MLEKVQSFADGKYDLSRKDIENIYLEQRGDAAEQLEEMAITKRMVSTGMSPPFSRRILSVCVLPHANQS